MELQHLRYFVAVADVGSLTVAAEQKLHTSQPSLAARSVILKRRLALGL
jgi:LysR family transcriptional regulator, hca operon transcriptional activator